MRRVVAAVFTLMCAVPASGTGVEDVGCRRYQLTSTELSTMDSRVKAIAGRRLDKTKVHACRDRLAVYASGESSHLHDADGSEKWFAASCVLEGWFSRRWRCGVTALRTVKVNWPGRNSELTAYLMHEADAELVRRRLNQAVAALGESGALKSCNPDENAAGDLARLQGEIGVNPLRVQLDELDHRFAISTYNFTIRFGVVAGPDAALHLQCWDRTTPQGFGVVLAR
jgi:hypothetical protein